MTAASRRGRTRPGRTAKQQAQKLLIVEETPMPPYSDLAIRDMEGAVGTYEKNAEADSITAQTLAAEALANEKAAREHDQAADAGEAEIKRVRTAAEAEARRIIDEGESRARQISASVLKHRNDAQNSRAVAAEKAEAAQHFERQSMTAKRAALFTAAQVKRAREEHNVPAVPGADDPEPPSMQRFNAAHDDLAAVADPSKTMKIAPVREAS